MFVAHMCCTPPSTRPMETSKNTLPGDERVNRRETTLNNWVPEWVFLSHKACHVGTPDYRIVGVLREN